MVPVHDWNFATVLECALNHLHVSDIVICGHSECDAIKALDQETDDVYIPLWLNNAQGAKDRIDKKLQKPVTPDKVKERSRMIEEENVRLHIEHLKKYPIVKNALIKNQIRIHGLYHNLETGELTGNI